VFFQYFARRDKWNSERNKSLGKKLAKKARPALEDKSQKTSKDSGRIGLSETKIS